MADNWDDDDHEINLSSIPTPPAEKKESPPSSEEKEQAERQREARIMFGLDDDEETANGGTITGDSENTSDGSQNSEPTDALYHRLVDEYVETDSDYDEYQLGDWRLTEKGGRKPARNSESHPK